MNGSKRVHPLWLFVLSSLTIRGFYIWLFHPCISFDLKSWDQVAGILMAGGNPYNITDKLNWPPVWMQVIFLAKKISLAWNLPFNDIIRVFLISVETATACLLYRAMTRFSTPVPVPRLLILGMALNPVCIFLVCQHCNFDVLAGFWILLAIYMLLRFQEERDPACWLCACFALGAGTVTKTVPFCLAPLLLLSARTLKPMQHFLGAAMLLSPVLLALSVLYVLGPHDIETKVLGYRGGAGTFGLSGLFAYFDITSLTAWWPRIFEIVYGSAWAFLGAWLWTREKLTPQELVSAALALLTAIPAAGPGYALQYAYWYLPLLLMLYGLSGRNIRMLLLVLYGASVAQYAIAYGFNYNSYGAFFLELFQNKGLLDFSARISTHAGETFISLPAWICYCILFGFLATGIGRMMARDWKSRRPPGQEQARGI